MPDQEQIKHWRDMVRILERNIYHLENQLTALGPYAPPYIRAQLEENVMNAERYRKLIIQATGAKND